MLVIGPPVPSLILQEEHALLDFHIPYSRVKGTLKWDGALRTKLKSFFHTPPAA